LRKEKFTHFRIGIKVKLLELNEEKRRKKRKRKLFQTTTLERKKKLKPGFLNVELPSSFPFFS
jgi:hypothetical protein